MAGNRRPHPGDFVARAEATAAGLLTYVPHRPCFKGHMERYVANRDCVQCALERGKTDKSRAKRAEWRTNNKQRISAVGSAHYLANKDAIKAQHAEWKAANKDHIRIQGAQYRKQNVDKLKETRQRWAKANKDKILARIAAWKKKYPERYKAAIANHTPDELQELFKRQRGRCAYCRVKLTWRRHADHIIPLAKGGTNWISNMQWTCSNCNHRKNARDPVAFARELGFWSDLDESGMFGWHKWAGDGTGNLLCIEKDTTFPNTLGRALPPSGPVLYLSSIPSSGARTQVTKPTMLFVMNSLFLRNAII